MIPIEDAVERAERRDRELARVQSDSSARLSRYQRTLHWINVLHDAIERSVYISFGYGFGVGDGPNRWTAIAFALLVLQVAIKIRLVVRWEIAVEDEKHRYDNARDLRRDNLR